MNVHFLPRRAVEIPGSGLRCILLKKLLIPQFLALLDALSFPGPVEEPSDKEECKPERHSGAILPVCGGRHKPLLSSQPPQRHQDSIGRVMIDAAFAFVQLLPALLHKSFR